MIATVTALRADDAASVPSVTALAADAHDVAVVPGLEDMPPVMSPKVLAVFLDTTVSTLQRWRDDPRGNQGPAYVNIPGTRLFRYMRPDVLAWLSQGRVEPGGKRAR